MKVSKTVFPENPSSSFNEWQEEIRAIRLERMLKEASELGLADLIEFKREVEKLLVNRIKK